MVTNTVATFIGLGVLFNLVVAFLNIKDINRAFSNQDVIIDIYRSLDKSLIDLTQAHCELLEDHCELKNQFEILQKKVDLLEQSVYNEV